mgnify:CR=1 FL=1|tara:strand:- start:2762 stop:3031 length:270 start_codon:yes stop_codon:yes gene_type:complete
MVRSQTIYKGRVQGVGFRWRVRQILKTKKITGFVRNKIDGTVELLIEGEIEEVSDALKIISETMKDYWISMDTVERAGEPHFSEFLICE